MAPSSKRVSLLVLPMMISLCLEIIPGLSAASLSTNHYNRVCPKALPTIRRVVEDAVRRERRMGASLLRLHFHDCFVNGCDGSILLDSTSTIDSEKNAIANANSTRGFDVVDKIKQEVDKACGRPVVSCADILAVAARDSVVALGGPAWKVALGRRDSTTASRSAADKSLPSPFMDLPELIKSFGRQGLNERDLVALSGGHTIGFAKCLVFKDRIHQETKTIDPAFARRLRSVCPRSGGDLNLAPLDRTPARFDSKYFADVANKRGLLHSDQALFNGGQTGRIVNSYAKDERSFYKDFASSMIKMGKLKPLTGKRGQIRINCRKVN